MNSLYSPSPFKKSGWFSYLRTTIHYNVSTWQTNGSKNDFKFICKCRGTQPPTTLDHHGTTTQQASTYVSSPKPRPKDSRNCVVGRAADWVATLKALANAKERASTRNFMVMDRCCEDTEVQLRLSVDVEWALLVCWPARTRRVTRVTTEGTRRSKSVSRYPPTFSMSAPPNKPWRLAQHW